MADATTQLFGPAPRQGACTRFSARDFDDTVAGTIYADGLAACGVPLGGLGTGYVEVGVDGSWLHTSIFNNFLEPCLLTVPALALAIGDEQWALSTRGSPGLQPCRGMQAWGHFPAIDLICEGLPVRAEVRMLSPFIPGDAGASNLPAILGEVWLHNESSADLSCRLLLNWPGQPMTADDPAVPTLRGPIADERAGYQGVHIRAEHGTEVALAFLAPAGPLQWGASPSQDGRWVTTGARPAATGRATSASLAQEVLVPAHGAQRLRFVLAWFARDFRDSDREPHRHRYATRYRTVLDVVARATDAFESLRDHALAWQRVVYGSDLPDWLQDSLVNSLYSLAKNTLWIHSARPDDWWGPDGLLLHSESFTGCPISETMVCRFHGHFPLLFFFPELELATLRAFMHFQLRSGEIPFSFGRPMGVNRPHYTCQHPLNSTEYVQLVHRYVERTGDTAVLRELYPSARDALRYALTLDSDGDGLINDQPHALSAQWPESWPANQFYDIWPWSGTSAYVAGIGLAALQAGAALAERAGDVAFAEECRALLRRGQARYEELLWTGRWYRLFADPAGGRQSGTCLANQLMALWCTRVVGLADVLPAPRVARAQESIARLNVAATTWGVVNGCHGDGRPDESGFTHSRDIFVGEALCAAMTFLYTGQTTTGLEIAQRLVHALVEHQRSPWNQYCLIRASDGLPEWGSDYYSNMVIWALPMALQRQDIATFSASGGLLDRILRRQLPACYP